MRRYDVVASVVDGMGVWGWGPRLRLKHLLFGCMTEEVVRRARCPAMVVKAPAHKAAMSESQPARAEAGLGQPLNRQ